MHAIGPTVLGVHIRQITCAHVTSNSCNMGARDLPDMYARGPRAEGIHIRRITSAHVTSTMYHFWHSKNLPNLQILLCLFI